jgi:serine/threonine protein kinase
MQNYLRCLLKALSHVHSYHFIHRDIKPSNFLYNFALNTGVLIDFGLAQRQPDSVEVFESRSSKKHLKTARKIIFYLEFPPTRLGCLINDTR